MFHEADHTIVDESSGAETPRKVNGPLDALAEVIGSCRRCPLSEGRTKAVPGEGPAGAEVLLVGEAPGRDEDRLGRPFVGRAGSILDRCLLDAGVDRSRIYITNVVKCRPPGNRRPNRTEVGACRPYLLAQFELLRPKVVILMGNAAARAVLDEEGVAELRGRIHRDRFLVTYHPAAVLRDGNLRAALVTDLLAGRKMAEE